MQVVDLQKLRQEIDARFVCKHERAHLRIKIASNGAKHYRVQCLRCGEFRQATREERSRASSQPELFDDELRQAWWAVKNKAYGDALESGRKAEKQAWFDQYSEYLTSPEWRSKRRAVLERDHCRCQARLPGCEVSAAEVHHLTYTHWWEAPLFELVAVCGPCHQVITEMDRANR